MRDGSYYAGKLEITYESREDALAQAPAWVEYRCKRDGLRVTGEIEYADSEYGNCSASVAAEYTHVGALRAVCAEFAAGEAIPANALAEAERLDAAGVSWGGVK